MAVSDGCRFASLCVESLSQTVFFVAFGGKPHPSFFLALESARLLLLVGAATWQIWEEYKGEEGA